MAESHTEKRNLIKLKELLSGSFRKASLVGATLVLIADTGYFVLSSIRTQRNLEEHLFSVVKESLKIPLMQGSFSEVNERLSKAKSSNLIYCGSITKWGFVSDNCTESVTAFTSKIESHLAFEESENIASQGSITLYFDRSEFIETIIFRMVFLFFTYFILMVWLNKILMQSGYKIEREFAALLDVIHQAKSRKQSENSLSRGSQLDVVEFSNLKNEFLEIIDEVKVLSKTAAISDVARQVAHDIASPLSALKILESVLVTENESKRSLLRSAIGRIDGIISLLKQTNESGMFVQLHQPIVPLLQKLVAEKVSEFSRDPSIKIVLEIDATSLSACVRLNTTNFMSCISNLINNSIESKQETELRVLIYVAATGRQVCITVKDDGKGIPENQLPLVFEKGHTYGKQSGSGLGLYSAKKFTEESGGTIKVSSKIGIGTNVDLALPVVEAPAWLTTSLSLENYRKIIVIESDTHFDEMWKQQFVGHDITIFREDETVPQEYFESKTTLFLVGHDPSAKTKSGIQFILANNIAGRAYLVTNRFDETAIVNHAQANSIKIIPKSLISSIPINFAT